MPKKFAVVLMAPESTPDGRGRLIHALTTAAELIDAGHEVRMLFDGIGVEVLTAFHLGENPFSRHYASLLTPVLAHSTACAVCSRHFGAVEAVEAYGIELIENDAHHRSLAPLLAEGFQVLSF